MHSDKLSPTRWGDAKSDASNDEADDDDSSNNASGATSGDDSEDGEAIPTVRRKRRASVPAVPRRKAEALPRKPRRAASHPKSKATRMERDAKDDVDAALSSRSLYLPSASACALLAAAGAYAAARGDGEASSTRETFLQASTLASTLAASLNKQLPPWDGNRARPPHQGAPAIPYATAEVAVRARASVVRALLQNIARAFGVLPAACPSGTCRAQCACCVCLCLADGVVCRRGAASLQCIRRVCVRHLCGCVHRSSRGSMPTLQSHRKAGLTTPAPSRCVHRAGFGAWLEAEVGSEAERKALLNAAATAAAAAADGGAEAKAQASEGARRDLRKQWLSTFKALAPTERDVRCECAAPDRLHVAQRPLS